MSTDGLVKNLVSFFKTARHLWGRCPSCGDPSASLMSPYRPAPTRPATGSASCNASEPTLWRERRKLKGLRTILSFGKRN